MTPRKVRAVELRLGNVVRLGDGPWMTAVVEKITYTEQDYRMVGFARPYMQPSYQSYGGDTAREDSGYVITLIGMEHFTVFGSEAETSTYDLLDERSTK